MLKSLTGRHLYFAFAAGSFAVLKQRDVIDRMNVFPVPDGDTGSNLSFTLKSAVDNSQIHDSVGVTLRSIADSALLGARGNSGLLFAQFINGLADSVGDKVKISKEHLVSSVKHAVTTAYRAISNPVEGTMLTVMREWSESMEAVESDHIDILSLLNKTLENAKQSLLQTKEKLLALRRNNVIDAGAKGFVEFLHGFIEYLKHAVLHGVEHAESHHLSIDISERIALGEDMDQDTGKHDDVGSLEDIPHRYCTECILSGDKMDPVVIREKLQSMGDSLIVAGSAKTVRIHIHANNPAEVFGVLTRFGLVSQQKADDMHIQFGIAGTSGAAIRLVVDSTCDIPDHLLLKHHISMVPLTVNFGDQAFLDRYTLDSSRFFSLLETQSQFPKTSQPSPALLKRTFQFLSTHAKQIIAVHLSGALSGTYHSSFTEADSLNEEWTHKGGRPETAQPLITVLDSKKISAAIGLCVLRAAHDIESGLSRDEVLEQLQLSLHQSRFFVTVPRLDNLIRGGRLSRAKAGLAQILNLRPVLSTDPRTGESCVLTKGFGSEGALKKTYAMIRAMVQKGPIHSWAVVHGNAQEQVKKVTATVREIIGMDPLFIGPISPVLGAHTGPGAINIAVLPK